MKISIVIPVYNEENRLDDCLLAIMKQTVKPHEVIVVDNNSNDRTVEIVKKYKFVKLLTEPHQGVIYARTTGFNYASGGVVGRIDADTIINCNWISNVQRIFKDKNVAAVSGKIGYHDAVLSRVSSKLDFVFRCWLANKMQKELFLQGANMAIRKSCWQDIEQHLCYQANIHEDFDLAIHLQNNHHKVTFDPSLEALISIRRFHTGPFSLYKYLILSPKSYKFHNLKTRIYMYPVIFLVMFCYGIIWLNSLNITRFFKKESVLAHEKYRVNPATFVD